MKTFLIVLTVILVFGAAFLLIKNMSEPEIVTSYVPTASVPVQTSEPVYVFTSPDSSATSDYASAPDYTSYASTTSLPTKTEAEGYLAKVFYKGIPLTELLNSIYSAYPNMPITLIDYQGARFLFLTVEEGTYQVQGTRLIIPAAGIEEEGTAVLSLN